MAQNNTALLIRLLAGLTASLLFADSALAAGELLISPTRVVFEKRTRTASVSIVNAGNEANTYRIQFVERRMTREGGFEEVKQAKAGEQFSSKMIRFSPRQVTLEPGQAQSVRLLIRKPASLADGEYRSHLLFRAIPKAETRSVDKLSGNKNITIQLTPIMGISIPVIVRHGQVSATARIEKLRYFAKTSNILFEMIREGNASVYGDITILFKDKTGQSTVLKKVNGLAVYTPNASRRMNFSIQPPGGIAIKNGTLTVLFHHTQKAGGKLITQHSVTIP